MNLPLTTSPVLAALAVALVATVVWVYACHRRGKGAISAVAAVVVMALLLVAAGVNSYFFYVPNVGALLGRRARYEASAANVRARLASSTPPSHGAVILADIPGRSSRFHPRRAQVYLPPAWFMSPRPHLPVIELLHGTPGGPADWTRAADADVTAERWAAKHDGVAPIIVMPDVNGAFWADTECVNGTAGNAETYLTQDVPMWTIAHLRAATSRGSWAIAGASEGGYCALMLALRHPSRYSTFADFSGLARPTARGGAQTLFRGSPAQIAAYLPANLLSHYHGAALAGWFAVGGSDGGTTRAVVAMGRKARAHGIRTRLTVMPGAHHTWRVWRSAFADAQPWLATQLGATSPPPSGTQLTARRQLHPVGRVDTDSARDA